MERSDMLNTLVDIIEADTGDRPNNVTEATRFEELGMESIDVLDTIFRAERHFRIRFNRTEIFTLSTFGDVLNAIERKMKEPPPPTA